MVALIAVALLVGSSVVSIGVLRHRVVDLALRVEPQSAQNREIRVAMNQSQADLRDYLANGRDPDFISAEDHEAMLDHIGTVGESSINPVPLGSGPDALAISPCPDPQVRHGGRSRSGWR